MKYILVLSSIVLSFATTAQAGDRDMKGKYHNCAYSKGKAELRDAQTAYVPNTKTKKSQGRH